MNDEMLNQRLKNLEKKQHPPLWLNLLILLAVLYAIVTIILPMALFNWQEYQQSTLQNPQIAPTSWSIEIDTIDVEGLLNDVVNTQGSIIIREEPAIIIVTGVPPAVVESAPIVTAVIPTQEPVLNATEAEKVFWADCAFKQGRGQRVSPRCPANAGELLGSGR